MSTTDKEEAPKVKLPEFIDPTKLKAGDKIKQKIFLQISTYGSISVSAYQFNEHIQVASLEVEFTVPEGFNPVQQAVAAIDQAIANVMDEAHKRTKPMKEKRNQLLQITYAGAEILDAAEPHLYQGNHEQR